MGKNDGKKVKYIKPTIGVVDFELFNKQFAKALKELGLESSEEDVKSCQRVYMNQKLLSRSSDFCSLYISVIYYCRTHGHPDNL